MSNKRKRVIIIGIIIVIVVIILFLGGLFFYLKEKNKRYEVLFSLVEPFEVTIALGEDYQDPGVNLTIDGEDRSGKVKIDSSLIDNSRIGSYKVKYYIVIDKKEYYTYRTVTVVDNIKPTITLNGSDTITILTNEEYKEPGYTASDNYDGNITDNVKIEENIDNKKEGEYQINYTVEDSSGNTATIQRKIIVKKPNVIVYEKKEENKENIKEVNPEKYSNTITKNNFTKSGIYLEGTFKNATSELKIKLSGPEVYTFNMNLDNNDKYKGTITFDDVVNGNYEVFIISDREEYLLNKLDILNRLVRSKINNKLISVNYDSEDKVNIKVEDFAYQYDILIDPGHGGSDTGASNEYILEKDMNLEVSKYEKCRYENHGLKVYMTRNNDTYGNGMGPDSLLRLHRRAYEMGYIGTVTKIIYSNHHNAISGLNYTGYEILIPGKLSKDELKDELSIADKFNSIYPLKENHLRFYARDYDTERKYSKLDGQVYNFKDNYAVNRIPHELFNVKSIIYEGSYLTGKEDYDWYWNNKNWLKVSEAKIEVYVTSLGISYSPDNSSCL